MATALQGISGLYITLYNRAADSDGQKFWAGVLGETVAQAATTTITLAQMQTLSTSFINTQSSYFNATYGSLTDTQFINALYINLGGNGGDTAGITFWVSLLAGGQTRAQVVGRFVNDFISLDLSTKPAGLSDADYAAAQTRQHTFQNKILVSLNYATNPAAILIPKTTTDDAFGAATRVIQGVTADDTTRDAAIAQISAAVAANNLNLIVGGGGVQGTTFTLTVGVDNVIGTSANDLVKGVADAVPAPGGVSTLQLFDSINLGAGTGDEADFIMVNGQVLSGATSPVLTGVERLMLTPTNAPTTAFMNQGFTPNIDTVGQIGGGAGFGSTFFAANGTVVKNVQMKDMVAGGFQSVTLNTVAGLTGTTDTVNVVLSNVSDTTGAGFDPNLFLTGFGAGDGFDLVNIKSTGAANTLTNLFVTSGTLAKLTVTGDQALTITNPIAFIAGGPENVDASANTGGVSVNVAGNTGPVIFKGGSGFDRIVVDVGELGLAGNSLDGGAGTIDHLAVQIGATYDFSDSGPANTIVLAAISAATGFETFQVVNTGGPGSVATVDPNKLGSSIVNVDFTTIAPTSVGAPDGDAVVKNNVDAEHISITKAELSSLTLTEKAGNHILNLDLYSSPTQMAGANAVVLNGVDTVNVTSNGGFVGLNGIVVGTAAFTGNVLLATGTVADNMTWTFKGNTDITVFGNGGLTVGSTYNASALTGKFQFFDAFNATFGDLITGTANADTFIVARKDQVTTGAGADKVFVTAANYAAATANDLTQVKDFTAGTDKLIVNFSAAQALRFFDATGLNVDAAADVAAAGNAAILGTLGLVPAAKDVYEFKWQGKLYDFINEDGDNVYTPGADVIVQVTGLVGTHTAGDFLV